MVLWNKFLKSLRCALCEMFEARFATPGSPSTSPWLSLLVGSPPAWPAASQTARRSTTRLPRPRWPPPPWPPCILRLCSDGATQETWTWAPFVTWKTPRSPPSGQNRSFWSYFLQSFMKSSFLRRAQSTSQVVRTTFLHHPCVLPSLLLLSRRGRYSHRSWTFKVPPTNVYPPKSLPSTLTSKWL